MGGRCVTTEGDVDDLRQSGVGRRSGGFLFLPSLQVVVCPFEKHPILQNWCFIGTETTGSSLGQRRLLVAVRCFILQVPNNKELDP